MRGLWVKLAENYWIDPKLLSVSIQAEALYVRMIAYKLALGETAAIPQSSIRVLATKIRNVQQHVDQLVSSGLLERQQTDNQVYYNFPLGIWEKWQGVAGQSPEAAPSRVRAGGRAGESEREEKRREDPPAPHLLEDQEQTAPPVAPVGPLADKLTRVVATWSGNYGTNGHS